MHYRSVIMLAAAAAVSTSTAAFAQCGAASPAQTVSLGAVAEDRKDIIDTAIAAGSFNTLAAALKAADLIDVLKGDGPFTVFAPTDAAFAKLPSGTVENLLKPENKDTLIAILTYHVVPGNVPASRVTNMKNAQTVNGQRIDIAVERGTVKIDNATVTTADVHATNGVIHVIDTVIMPSTKDIVDTAKEAGSFNTLLAAAKAAGLVDALKGDGPLTVFAPTDEAFAKLGSSTIENLLMPENKEQLQRILLHHVVAGRVYSDAVKNDMRAETLAGTNVQFTIRGERVMIGSARIGAVDIDTANGVIHVIDSVILPD